MAFDPKPSTWLPNWSENGTNITVPVATFPEMTADEADADTGDIRKVVFAILEKLVAAWYATDAANRPSKMYMSKNSSLDVITNVQTNTYTFRLNTTVNSQEVVDED